MMFKISILLSLLATLIIRTRTQKIDDMLLGVGYFNVDGGSGDPITSGDLISGEEPSNDMFAIENFAQTDYANTNIPAKLSMCMSDFQFSAEPVCYMGKGKICFLKESFQKPDSKLKKQILSFLSAFLHENFKNDNLKSDLLVMNPTFAKGKYKAIIEIPSEATSTSVRKLIKCLYQLAGASEPRL